MEDSVFLSAGDPSGDNASARLVEKLFPKKEGLTIFGLGGKRLKQLGQIQYAEPSDLAVIGFWEVAKKYFFFRRLFHKVVDEIKTRKPKVIILVDYPGFNLRLAKKVKKFGIPIIYYISPQIWAWGKNRIEQIKEYIDLMIPILPFEEQFYTDSGVNTKYVGHYLLEDIPSEYIASSIPNNGHLALLPGSRSQEIERMLPSMIETAGMFYKKYNIKSIIAGVHGITDYDRFINSDNEFISIVYDNPRKVVFEAQVVLTASGTATLETGIIGRPMVVVYRTGAMTYFIAKNLVKLDKIALVNLVLEEKAVPELIQNDASPDNMFRELERFYTDESYRKNTKEKLDTVAHILGDSLASERAAELILEYLN